MSASEATTRDPTREPTCGFHHAFRRQPEGFPKGMPCACGQRVLSWTFEEVSSMWLMAAGEDRVEEMEG